MSEPSGFEAPRRARWSEIKAALESAGFEPSRALGQNFLVDIDDAGLSAGSLFLQRIFADRAPAA